MTKIIVTPTCFVEYPMNAMLLTCINGEWYYAGNGKYCKDESDVWRYFWSSNASTIEWRM